MSPFLSTLGGGSVRGFGRGFGRAGLLGPLGAPTNLSSSAPTTGQVALNWTNGDATAQTQIYRGGSLVTTVSAGITSFTNTGLANFTGYSYYVVHIKNNILSANSNTSSVTTLPAPPSNLSYTANSTSQLTLSWTNGDNSATTTIYRNGGYLTDVGAGVTSYADSGFNADTSNTYYIVHARDGLTSVASSTITGYTLPAAPFGFAGTGGSTTSNSLSWGVPFSSQNHPVYLYRNGALILITSTPANSGTYIDTGLSPSTTYSYEVKHYNSTSGLFSAGSTISVTTNAPVVGQQVYTTAGQYTFTVPNTITQLRITLVGGGGGGSGGSQGYAGNGGGAGGTITNRLVSVSPGNQLTVYVGAGGTGGNAANNNATAGGATTVSTPSGNLDAYYGLAGNFMSNTVAAGGAPYPNVGSGGTTSTGGSGALGSVGVKGGNGGNSSLATGGTGASFGSNGGAGSQGSGGGGGYGSYQLAQASNGGNGGAGYVKIEYGY